MADTCCGIFKARKKSVDKKKGKVKEVESYKYGGIKINQDGDLKLHSCKQKARPKVIKSRLKHNMFLLVVLDNMNHTNSESAHNSASFDI